MTKTLLLILTILMFSTILADNICSYKIVGTATFFDKNKEIKTFKIALATTPKQHEKGLMNCTMIPNNKGLLFIFKKPSLRYFWMKNTPTPLSIIFISKEKVVVSAKKGEPFSQKLIPSEGVVNFVLEVPFSGGKEIKKGNKVSFSFQ